MPSLSTAVQRVQGMYKVQITNLAQLKAAPRKALSTNVQRVQGRPYVTREKLFSITKKISLARIYVPCTPSTHSTAFIIRGFQLYKVFFCCLRPCTLLLILKKMTKIICGPDNTKTFRDEMKAHTPAFYDFAKELYQNGLIDGLRGATLEITEAEPVTITTPTLASSTPRYCQDCNSWKKDKTGDGNGIGQCLLNIRPSHVKWPKTPACDAYSTNL